MAVAGKAGVNCYLGREFDYGFDGSFRPVVLRNSRRVESGYALDFQLKCTWNWEATATDVNYKLNTKTYNDLVTRDPAATAAILIVMCLPVDHSGWLTVTEDQMVMRKCCYFTSLAGPQVSNDDSTKKIHIPRTNLFGPDALLAALQSDRARLESAFE